MGVELPLHVVVTILECCVTFSGVKLSIRSFVLFIYYWVPSFEIQTDIFMSVESIWRAFRRVKYRKTSKNISLCFERRHLIIYLLSNHKIWRWGGKNIGGYYLNWWTKISPKVNFYTNQLNWRIFNGGGKNFGGTNLGGKNFGPLKSLGFQQLSYL